MFATLGWASYKILMIGQRSAAINETRGPAYTLYSDPAALNRWGYLYVQFRADAYYYIVPLLLYILAKSLAIAFGQTGGVAQSIVVLVIETAYLAAVVYLRPWLDRRTNIVNIAIAVVNFLNAILVVIFSGVTGAPNMVPGVLGVVFFITNAIFALILLILLAIAVCFAIFSKNPEERYRGDTPLPTAAEKPNVRDLDADVLTPPAALQTVPPRDLHSRGESERGTMSLRGHDESKFKAPSPFPAHLNSYEPSRRTSMHSQYSSRSQRGRGGGSNWNVGPGYDRERSAPPSAQHYVEKEPQRSPIHGGGNWNVGAGYERDSVIRREYRA